MSVQTVNTPLSKIKNRQYYLLLVLIQCMLLFAAFKPHFTQSGETIFCNSGDGMKNYFTLQAYVSNPIDSGGIFKFNQMAYPFGDYVFYTDNTPFFAIPMRWFCQRVYDISDYTIPLYNLFMLSNILFCSLLAFSIFKKLIDHKLIAFLLALALPWIGPQVQRLFFGHFNLSLSSLSLIAIALFMWWQRNKENKFKQIGIAILIVAFCVASFIIHGYYMAIITIFISVMMVFASVSWIKKDRNYSGLLISLFTPLLTIALILLLLQVTDAYLPLRKEVAMGYDWSEQKTIFSRLHTHYHFHSLYFPIFSARNNDASELNSYLGNIGLYTCLLLFLGLLVSKSIRTEFYRINKDFFSDNIKRSIFLGGLVLLLISFGESYYTQSEITKFKLPIAFEGIIPQIILTVFIIACLVYFFYACWQYSKTAAKKVSNKERIVVILIAACSVYLFIGEYSATVRNYLNPFLYLHLVSARVEQFRSLARFNWPFFWTFYIWIMYVVAGFLRNASTTRKSIMLASIFILGIVEVLDNTRNIRNQANDENFFSKAAIARSPQANIDYSNFQAILSIPIYMAGSEDYDHTFDDEDGFTTFTMQCALKTKLPLMACKLSRTPPEFSVQLIDFVANDIISPDIKNKLNKKPLLLIVKNKQLIDTNAGYVPSPERPLARAAFMRTLNFAERHNLVPIDSNSEYTFYSYQVP